MRIANLFDCFERHLGNLDIISETSDLFVAKIIEDYMINLNANGFTMGEHAEDIYVELQEEVTEMLQKKIYGFYDLDAYRDHLRAYTKVA